MTLTSWGGTKLNIVIFGQGGYGKSTLINNFLSLPAEWQARTGRTGGAVTTTVTSYSGIKNGILVTIFDTPGFSDPDAPFGETLKMLKKKTQGVTVHLLLYCVSLRVGRVNKGDHEVIRQMTKVFDEKLWKQTVFVFTFANEECKKDDYKTLIQTLQSKVGRALSKDAGVRHSSFKFAEAGNEESDLTFSDGSKVDWRIELLKQSLHQVEPEAACCLLNVVLTDAEKQLVVKAEEGKQKSVYWKIGMGVAAGALLVGGLATGGALYGVAAASAAAASAGTVGIGSMVGTGAAVSAGAVGGVVGGIAGGIIGTKLTKKDKMEIDEILRLKYNMWKEQQKAAKQ